MYTTQTCSIFLSKRIDLDLITETWAIDATIKYISYQNICRGESKKPANDKKYFFNTCTCIFVINGHTINVKLSSNGSIQLTGCRRSTDVNDVFDIIWHRLNSPDLTATIVISMTNYTIIYPHILSKICLDNCLEQAPFDIVLINEPFYCRPGLFFKIPLTQADYLGQKVDYITCRDGKKIVQHKTFEEYLSTLPLKKRIKKLEQHFIAFTIFESGSCNVSGISAELTERVIAQVLGYIKANYPMPLPPI